VLSDDSLSLSTDGIDTAAKGQRCEVLVRAKVMNSCLVRFSDGYTMVTSRNALAKNKEGK